jgi:hypothetical protein
MSWNHSKAYIMAHITGAVALLALIAMIFLTMCGCRTMNTHKTDIRDSVSVRDSVVMKVVARDSVVTTYRTRDTAIGVPAGSVGVRVSPSQLDSGRVTKRSGRVAVSVSKNVDGTLSVDCAADSLTIVVADLQSLIVYKNRVIDSLVRSSSVTKERQSVKDVRVTVPRWKWALLGVLIAIVIGIITYVVTSMAWLR